MTSAELYKIVKDWPKGSWPDGVAIEIHSSRDVVRRVLWITPDHELPADHAALMFEASGMRYLVKKCGNVVFDESKTRSGRVAYSVHNAQLYPSILEAMSAAILCLKENP